jgi:hypothetical protein
VPPRSNGRRRICDHLDATQNPNATVDFLVSIGHTNRNANMWLDGSVLYLCPRLNYLTHYATNRHPLNATRINGALSTVDAGITGAQQA